jgi:parvulin-like peptidyl-prolyl isomerase
MEQHLSVGRIVREPLLHFLLIGLALFLYYGHVASGSGDDRRIVVTQMQLDDLAQQFQRTWSRPPTGPELQRLIDSYIHDEVLYRQGMAAGLGRDDAVIKRRIRQKIEVMAEEEGERTTPTDSDLAAYLQAHPEKFVRPAVVSFEQLYFDPATPGTQARIDAAKAALATGRAATGQPSMLPRRIDAQDIDTVARDYGPAFAATLATLPTGQWTGPVLSGLGVHLVRIDAWTPAALPSLAEVRAQVQREWENDRRKRALDASYQKVRANYEVVIKAKLPSAQ